MRRGETLSSIARDHHVPLRALIRANPQLRDPDRIFAGQALQLPAASAIAAPGAAPARAPDPAARATASPTPSVGRATPRPRSRSEGLALDHLPAMNRHKATILQVAAEKGLDPAILAGLISRESGAGTLLDRSGRGDHGNGHGLMQLDIGAHAAWLAKNNWRDPLTNLRKGADILNGLGDAVKRRAAEEGLSPTPSQLQTWTLSAYNTGAENAIAGVLRRGRSDARTTGHNFAKDVLARAELFRRSGYTTGAVR